ncbi:MAG: hypothetical protein N3E36_07325 [Sulfolobales archaeon]|nr:hypothetical protein [Ignisphaera sp.]MCX8199802.1 hypothetical protein [Sulfolobales archaeon]MDW8084958.1 hypothetical protein [Ignisphaera sp.]
MGSDFIARANILKRIYVENTVTSTRLSRVIEVDYRKIVSAFNVLRDRYGVSVWVDVLQSRLGLGLVLLLLKGLRLRPPKDPTIWSEIAVKLPYPRSIAWTPTGELQLVFQSPLRTDVINVEDVKEYVAFAQKFDFVLRSKPLVELLDMFIELRFGELTERGLDIAMEHSYRIDKEYILSSGKFDGLDLAILNILEPHPEVTLRKLTQEVNNTLNRDYSMTSIEYHLDKHVENMILGYRVANYAQSYKLSETVSIIILSCRNPLEFCSRVISHPFIISCVGDSRTSIVATNICAPSGYQGSFILRFIEKSRSYSCGETLANIQYLAIPPYIMVFAVPRPWPKEYVREIDEAKVEYDPRSRSWSATIDVKEVVGVLTNYLSS